MALHKDIPHHQVLYIQRNHVCTPDEARETSISVSVVPRTRCRARVLLDILQLQVLVLGRSNIQTSNRRAVRLLLTQTAVYVFAGRYFTLRLFSQRFYALFANY